MAHNATTMANTSSGQGSRQVNGGRMDDNMTDPYDETMIHKTILVGDSGVGKTSLLVQFDQGKFQVGSFSATVGIGFTAVIQRIDSLRE